MLLIGASMALLTESAYADGLEEIVVTARKREESILNIPVAVTAISGERLDRYQLRSLEQISASTPELTVVRGSNGSGATLSLRGIGSSYTSIGIEQSVAVNVDGVYYGQGRIINEGFFDMKQVEILKGPQALFFGKNSTSGVRLVHFRRSRRFVRSAGTCRLRIRVARTSSRGSDFRSGERHVWSASRRACSRHARWTRGEHFARKALHDARRRERLCSDDPRYR